jgi:Fe-S cluster biogenesis protein NfuA
LDDRAARELAGRVNTSLETIESMPDSPTRVAAAEALQCLLELYGEGFARTVAHMARRCGPDALREFADDDVIGHLLLLHGLHPVDVEVRVRGALEDVRPYLASHGGNIELLRVAGGVAYVRLQGSCDGCPSSALTLKSAVEEAVLKAAPDIARVEAEGVAARPTAGFIPIGAVRVGSR